MSLQIRNDLNNIIKDVINAYGLADCSVGKVISESPLSVEISKTEEVFEDAFLILPKTLTDYDIEIEIDGERKSITVYNALKTGDSVIILKCFKGQRLLILDRL